MLRKSIRLLTAAWIVFTVSLFLPAAEDMAGWRCAAACAAMITNLKEWLGVYYFVFTIPNLLMLLSPLIVYRLNRKPHKLKWLNFAALFCALYVSVFGIINWTSQGFALKIGYYLWLVSFWLLFIGLISMKPRGSAEKTPQFQDGAVAA